MKSERALSGLQLTGAFHHLGVQGSVPGKFKIGLMRDVSPGFLGQTQCHEARSQEDAVAESMYLLLRKFTAY